MKITVSQLINSITESEAFSYCVDLAKNYGFSATAFQSGSIVYSLLKAQAACFSIIGDSLKLVVENAFLETCTGDFLTRKASNDFDIIRNEASQTELQVKLNISGGSPEVFDIGEVKIKIAGKQYYLSRQLEITIDGNYDGYFLSDLFGSATRPGLSNIPEFSENPIQGATFVSVESNQYYKTIVDGQDKETDENLRLRCKSKWATLGGNGTEDLYLYWIKNSYLSNGEPVSVNRIKIDQSIAQASGIVYIYLSTPSGAPSVEEIQACNVNIQKYRAICAYVAVDSATEKTVAYRLKIKVNGSAGESDSVRSAVVSIIDNYYSTINIGGTTLEDGNGYVIYQEIAEKIMQLTGIINVEFLGSTVDSGTETQLDDVKLNAFDVPVISSIQGSLIEIVRIS